MSNWHDPRAGSRGLDDDNVVGPIVGQERKGLQRLMVWDKFRKVIH